MTNERIVIGLAGELGSGKSEVAWQLAKALSLSIFGVVDKGGVYAFAAPIKDMLEAIGVPQHNLYGVQSYKEEPLELLCGKSARTALQYLGTEWGRALIGGDIWVNAWRERIKDQQIVICDDVRFHNEVAAIHAEGGMVFRLVGRGGSDSQHISEREKLAVDADIDNSGSAQDTVRLILTERFLSALREEQTLPRPPGWKIESINRATVNMPKYTFCHDNYDGPPSPLCGYASSYEEALEMIKEIEEEMGWVAN